MVLLLFAALFCIPTPVFAANYIKTIEVRPTNNATTNRENIQKALNEARLYANSSDGAQVQVVLKPGIHSIDGTLLIFSNTEIKLEDGATVKRYGSDFDDMLYTALTSEKDGAYKRANNITIAGGIWDSSDTKDGYIFHFTHSQNIRILDTTLKNNHGLHTIILEGDKDVSVQRVSFENCNVDADSRKSNKYTCETIHVDAVTPGGTANIPSTKPWDGTPCENVAVDNCSFVHSTTAVGAHYLPAQYTKNHKNIQVSHNLFADIDAGGFAVSSYRYDGWTVSNNIAMNYKGGFLRLQGASGFSVSNNVVKNTSSFVEDCGAATTRYNSGEFRANKVSNAPGRVIISKNKASNLRFENENYSSSRTTYARATDDNYLVFINGSNAIFESCSFANSSTAKGSAASHIACVKLENGKFTFRNSTVSGTPGAALCLTNATSGTLVENNSFKNCGSAQTGTDSYTIHMHNSSGATVKKNSLEGCKEGGIYLSGSSGNKVLANNIQYSGNGYSVLLASSSKNNTVTDNKYRGKKAPWADKSSTGNTFKNNTGMDDISKAKVSGLGDMEFTGSELKPKPTLTLGGKTLKNGTDYKLSYKNNLEAGTATLTITGKGGYYGTKTATFKIGKASISKLSISVKDVSYTGKAQTPEPVVKLGNVVLKNDTHYTLAYKNNTEIGSATLTLQGKGSVESGSKSISFKILPASIAGANVVLPKNIYTYTGSAILPTPIQVSYDGVSLQEGIDYSVSCENNVAVGMATLTLTGMGSYGDTQIVNFEIVDSASSGSTSGTDPKPVAPQIVDSGVCGTTNWSIDSQGLLRIWPANGSSSKLEALPLDNPDVVAEKRFPWLASTHASEVVKLVVEGSVATPEDSSYLFYGLQSLLQADLCGLDTTAAQSMEYAFEGCISLSRYGVGNSYDTSLEGAVPPSSTGTWVAEDTPGWYNAGESASGQDLFEITDVWVDDIPAQTWTGSAVKPDLHVRHERTVLTAGSDYTVSWKDNVEPGIAKVTITGHGAYSGSVTKSFVISSPKPVHGRTYAILSAANTNYALDIAGGSREARANAAIYKRNGTEAQAFTFYEQSDGSWQILNYKGMALDIAGASRSNSANLETYPWLGTGAQKFVAQENSDGTLTFVNVNSGKVLDISGGKFRNSQNVQQYTANETDAQKWVLLDVTSKMAPKRYEGTYTIGSAVSKDFVLDIKGASKADKANLQVYKSNGTVAQRFTLSYRGDGYYSITNASSLKPIDVNGGRAVNGRNVWQYTYNGSKAQLWQVVKNNDGSYTFKSAINTGYVIDLSGAQAYNGSNVHIYKGNNTKAQRWVLQ